MAHDLVAKLSVVHMLSILSVNVSTLMNDGGQNAMVS